MAAIRTYVALHQPGVSATTTPPDPVSRLRIEGPMHAYFSRLDTIGGSLPRPDFLTIAAEEAVRLAHPNRGRLAHRMSDFVKHRVARLASRRQRKAGVAELSRLSDHELADIGFTRSDLPRIMDPAFIADHEQRGQFIGE